MAIGGQLWVEVRPSLVGFGADLRRQIEESVPPEIRVRIRPDSDPAQQGSQQAGAFAAAYRARLAAALRDLPEIEITANSSDADRELAAIRARLAELHNTRIGVDLDAAAAAAEVDRLRERLARLAAESPDIRVRVDAGSARAELEALRAEINRLDGRDVDVRVDANGAAAASSEIGGVGSAITGLARTGAVVDVVSFAFAGLGAVISVIPAGIAAIAGPVAVLAGAFNGIGGAISAADKAQTGAGKNSQQAAAQLVNAASQIAAAQDGIASAERSLAQARLQAADGAISAAEKVANAEAALAVAQRAAQTVQENLTQARKDAAATLQALSFSVEDNALAQRQAAIQLAQAQTALAAFNRTGGTDQQRDIAVLGVDSAQQRVLELRAQGVDLAAKKADADKRGIEGSTQVTAAQNANTAAVQRTKDAERSLADARRAQALQQVTAANSIASAVQGVTSAQRALESAQRSAAQSATGASSATNAYAAAMAKLSPAGRDFVKFYLGELKPRLDELGRIGQQAFLPSFTQMLRDAGGLFPVFKTEMGDLATLMAGTARQFGSLFKSADFKANLQATIDSAKPIISALGGLLVSLTGDLASFGAKMAPAAQGFADFITKIGEGLSGFFKELAADGGGEAFKGVWEALGDIAKEILPIIGQSMREGAKAWGPALKDLADFIIRHKDGIQGFFNWLATTGAGDLKSILSLLDGLSGLVKVVKFIAKAITDGFMGALDFAQRVKKYFSDTFHDVIKSIKDFLGIASPSKVFAQIGSDMLQGLLNGLVAVRDSVVKFFTGLWANIRIGATAAWTRITTFLSDTWTNIRNGVSVGLGGHCQGVRRHLGHDIADYHQHVERHHKVPRRHMGWYHPHRAVSMGWIEEHLQRWHQRRHRRPELDDPRRRFNARTGVCSYTPASRPSCSAGPGIVTAHVRYPARANLRANSPVEEHRSSTTPSRDPTVSRRSW